MKTGAKMRVRGLGVGEILRMNIRAAKLIPGADPELLFARVRMANGRVVLASHNRLEEIEAPIQRVFLGAA